jgi:NitT/TauT family transport system substrate-binding protein
MLRQRAFATTLTALALIVAACGGDDNASADAPPSTEPMDEMSIDVAAGEAFPAARCEANQAAGTISYLSGFDFAATASIVDVLVADHNGYYDEL